MRYTQIQKWLYIISTEAINFMGQPTLQDKNVSKNNFLYKFASPSPEEYLHNF